VLTINYFRSGSTGSCCAFSIAPSSFTGTIDATTCAQDAVAATPVTSHFNADASCPCADDVAPLPPTIPQPRDEGIKIALWPTLTWTAVDWDDDIVAYDVYFGTSPTPPLAVTVTDASWEHGPLDPMTTYYWRVVARDALGQETSGPVWHFTTRTANHTPVFQGASPSGGVPFPISGILDWSFVDPDGDPMVFELYLGTTFPPPFLTRVSTYVYKPQAGFQSNATYYWRLVAIDEPHSSTTTAIMAFTTPLNMPPTSSSNPIPADNSVGTALNPVLSWLASDQDDQAVTCDVYFGASSSPPLAAQGRVKEPDGFFRFTPNSLSLDQRYYWRVDVRDHAGLTTSGATWTFTTGPNHPPVMPSEPNPPNGAILDTSPTKLTWRESMDEDGQSAIYLVYFGDTYPPPFLNTSGSIPVNSLAPRHQYFWRVVAFDGADYTVGPTWSFFVGGPLPVLFSRFEAKTSGSAARLSWELHSDESMKSYTIYRSTGNNITPVAITNSSVHGISGSYVDRGVEGGKTYRYQMVVKTSGGDEYRSQNSTVTMPALELALEPNHPNPFNPQTTIPYVVPAGPGALRVRLIIYDASGRTVRILVNEDQPGGSREVVWHGDDESGTLVSSGIYFCVLQAGKEQRTQKLVLLK
jgi:hypothetical protein